MPNIVGNVYDKYKTSNPITRFLMQGFFSSVLELYRTTKPIKVLEVGCGEGHLAYRLLFEYGYDTVNMEACDLSLHRVVDAYREVITFREASVYELPYNDNSFDLVICCEVLEHLECPGKALEEIARVTADSILLSTPWEPVWRMMNMARGKYLRDLGNTPGHIQHYSRGALTSLVKKQFEIVAIRKPLPWTVILAKPLLK